MKIPDNFAAKLLDGLRPRERHILGLEFFDQFTTTDVAELLQIRPDSVAGHKSKGLATVAKIVQSDRDGAAALLDAMGEDMARERPKVTISIGDEGSATKIGILPHRQIKGADAIRGDHIPSDTSRFFIEDINGEHVGVAAAGEWVLRASMRDGLALRREVLHAKEIKLREKFDDEAQMYFFPSGLGCEELYFERDFDHRPMQLPAPPGESLLTHVPSVVADLRSQWLPEVWPLRVIDLGEHRKDYDEAMATDAERALRRRPKK